MLAVKREQREALGDPAFVDRTIGRLRDYYLEYVCRIEANELRERVKHAIKKARSYGLTNEGSITTFVLHMMTINPEFDKHPKIQKALHDTEVTVNSRMSAMMATVSDRNWHEAAKIGDPEAYWAKVREERGKEVDHG